MRILPIHNTNIYSTSNKQNSFQQPSFEQRTKLIDLHYVIEKQEHLLPQRVKTRIKEIISKNPSKLPTLMEIHKSIYTPLLKCNTLEEVKTLYPEFEGVNDANIKYRRKTANSELFTEEVRLNLALKCLKDFWGELKTKEEIAKSLGMKDRTTLDWTLKKMGFVSYPSNYKTLLRASDPESQKIIADKTRAWNAAHPDLMRERNKHAAQFTKTPEYREAQAKRIKEYDIEHPERRSKISDYATKVWELCPDIKQAMAEFAMNDSPYVRNIVLKRIHGEKLNDAEKRINKGFYKRFWSTYPEYKDVYRAAREQISKELRLKKEK